MTYEYRVVPAPRRGEKAKGVKTTSDRFAYALTALMNRLAADGWEYLRADTLPCEERVGLTGRTTTFQNVLVFRRALAREIAASPVAEPPSADRAPAARPVPEPAAEPMLANLPERDALDDAARRAGVAPPMAPVVTRPMFGSAPRLVPVPDASGPSPALGPARPHGTAESDNR